MIKFEMHPQDVRALIDLISRAPLRESIALYAFLNQQLVKHEQPEQQGAQPSHLRSVPMTAAGGVPDASD